MSGKSKLADLTVVIPTYNRPVTLLDTISSYLGGRVLPGQIVVVDQSPNPFDPTVLGDLKGVEIDVIRCDIPSSTLARNIGARASKYDTLLFSDDDILVNEDSISVLSDDMVDTSIALIAGVDIAENAVHGCPAPPLWYRDVLSFLFGMKKPWCKGGYVIKTSMRGRYPMPVSSRVSTEWAMGYFFCVRRSLMEKWNIWFDEKLERYAYAEDLDFSMRYCSAANDERLAAILEPSIFVHHLGSGEWRTPSEEATRYYIKNRRYLARKNFPNRPWYLLTMAWFDTLWGIYKLRSNPGYSKCLFRMVFSNE